MRAMVWNGRRSASGCGGFELGSASRPLLMTVVMVSNQCCSDVGMPSASSRHPQHMRRDALRPRTVSYSHSCTEMTMRSYALADSPDGTHRPRHCEASV